MEVHARLGGSGRALDAALQAAIEEEFPPRPDGITYLNSGSAGRKPICVLSAVQEANRAFNSNPTINTFIDDEPRDKAREVAARLFAVHPASLMLTANATQGLQLIMQSFLQKPGDELVTTNREHGSSRTIMRFLEETRGIVIKKYEVPENANAEQLYLELLSMTSEKTKLVLVSEIDCHTGWAPDLSMLTESLELMSVPLLVDGAHSPGHILARPARYPLWVGSGHKWLGAPNGTGFAYIRRELIPHLEPVTVADQYYEKRDEEIYDLTRFECQGTSEPSRWPGLTAAVGLFQALRPERLLEYERALVVALREKLLERFPFVKIRTPVSTDGDSREHVGLLTFHFPEFRLKTDDLRADLWESHKIWVQPDFLNSSPGHGMRVSCHYSNTESDLDRLVEALSNYVA